MAAKTKKAAVPPRRPERKWGPFHGGLGIAVWLNEVETEEGQRFFRAITVAPRRYRDKVTGEWKDASSLRPTDLSTLQLALQAAHDFIHSTPLPGEGIEPDEIEDAGLYEGEGPSD
jgi:hypothetical protein